MSVTIEQDLKEILDRFEKKLDKLESKIDKLDDKVDNLTVEVATVKTKVEGIEKRLDNQVFLSRGIIIGLIVAILGGFAKFFGVIDEQGVGNRVTLRFIVIGCVLDASTDI